MDQLIPLSHSRFLWGVGYEKLPKPQAARFDKGTSTTILSTNHMVIPMSPSKITWNYHEISIFPIIILSSNGHMMFT